MFAEAKVLAPAQPKPETCYRKKSLDIALSASLWELISHVEGQGSQGRRYKIHIIEAFDLPAITTSNRLTTQTMPQNHTVVQRITNLCMIFWGYARFSRFSTTAFVLERQRHILAKVKTPKCWLHDPSVSKTQLHSNTKDAATSTTLVNGMAFIQTQVLDALNDLYDPKEIAREQARKKLEKQQKKGKFTDDEVEEKVQVAVEAAGDHFTLKDTAVTQATKTEFGDYQCNAALALGGRAAANQLMDRLALDDAIFDTPEIAGPGFLNIRYSKQYLESAMTAMANEIQLPTTKKQTLVIDYSSPNIAKEMHVGHLRSTVIGDCLASLLELSGHKVVRLNHVGDWGTQFGMLVEHLRDEYPEALKPGATVDLGDLVVLYKQAKKRFDVDEDFQQRSRKGVVALQSGSEDALAAWHTLCEASRKEFHLIYNVLNIQNLEERGESFYNPFLLDVVQDLKDKGLAVESDGATVVFLDGYENRDGSPLPVIIQKSDGGFNYATTDLAAIRHRCTIEKADRILYVTDAGQSQHFEMVFKVAKLAGYVPEHVSLEHVPFGLVQGEDGKKFATRSGDTVKLKDLLDTAVERAARDLADREGSSDNAELVGIAAVKYADLSMNRESNYRFSYDRMLSLNGNTAPYMLYAYARICGIIRKAGDIQGPSKVMLDEPSEVELARNLVKLPDLLKSVENDLYPNRLCEYLFDTSQKFNQFYENCSVNNAETEDLKASRLTLCTATASTLQLLLNLLGIPVTERL